MHNPYIEYYKNQAGSGISVFKGIQYQRGHGFFGTFLSTLANLGRRLFTKGVTSGVLPEAGKYLLGKAADTGMSLAGDIANGENVGESFKKNFKNLGNTVLDDAKKRAMKYAQTGPGQSKRRRRRRRKVSMNINKLFALKKKSSVSNKKRKSKQQKKKKTTKKKPSKSRRKKSTKNSNFDFGL